MTLRARIFAGAAATLVAGGGLLATLPHAQADPTARAYSAKLAAWERTFIDPRQTPIGPTGNCDEDSTRFHALQGYASKNRGGAEVVHRRYKVPTNDPVLAYSYRIAREETQQAWRVQASLRAHNCPQKFSTRATFSTPGAQKKPGTCSAKVRAYHQDRRSADADTAALRRYKDTYHVPWWSKSYVNYTWRTHSADELAKTSYRDWKKHCT